MITRKKISRKKFRSWTIWMRKTKSIIWTTHSIKYQHCSQIWKLKTSQLWKVRSPFKSLIVNRISPKNLRPFKWFKTDSKLGWTIIHACNVYDSFPCIKPIYLHLNILILLKSSDLSEIRETMNNLTHVKRSVGKSLIDSNEDYGKKSHPKSMQIELFHIHKYMI